MPEALQEILEDQKGYYQARAAEYDEWFYRRERYDYGPEHTVHWQAEVEQVRVALGEIDLTGHVLELAAGTGIWTQELIKTAGHVTALDSSEEMLAINRQKLQSHQMTYILADLFYWQPVITYDAVFMGFWLSHVPPTQLYNFIGTVAASLKPGGKIFFVDSLPEPSSTAKDMAQELAQRGHPSPTLTAGQTTLRRRLNDGREFKIVKIFYEADKLARQFETYSISMTVKQTDRFFLYGWGFKV